MNNWLVVANAARARVLASTEEPDVLVHVADLVHARSRQKGIELGHDRPGHVEGTVHGPGSAAYVPRTDVRERERDRFAREVADLVNHGVAAGRCAGLVLVASNPFLGRLKSHLSEQAARQLLRTESSDCTLLSDADLVRRLWPVPGD